MDGWRVVDELTEGKGERESEMRSGQVCVGAVVLLTEEAMLGAAMSHPRTAASAAICICTGRLM